MHTVPAYIKFDTWENSSQSTSWWSTGSAGDPAQVYQYVAELKQIFRVQFWVVDRSPRKAYGRLGAGAAAVYPQDKVLHQKLRVKDFITLYQNGAPQDEKKISEAKSSSVWKILNRYDGVKLRMVEFSSKV
jgi:hypothetical protein